LINSLYHPGFVYQRINRKQRFFLDDTGLAEKMLKDEKVKLAVVQKSAAPLKT